MIYLVAALVYALDQWLKWLVRTHMAIGQAVPVVPPVLYLDYILNPGGAFGILPNARWLFVVVAIAVIAAVVVADRRFALRPWTRVGFALVLGGALGNLTDRMLTGRVVDYVYLQVIHFPVFNLADVAIDCGVAILVLRSLLADKRSQSEGVEQE